MDNKAVLADLFGLPKLKCPPSSPVVNGSRRRLQRPPHITTRWVELHTPRGGATSTVAMSSSRRPGWSWTRVHACN